MLECVAVVVKEIHHNQSKTSLESDAQALRRTALEHQIGALSIKEILWYLNANIKLRIQGPAQFQV